MTVLRFAASGVLAVVALAACGTNSTPGDAAVDTGNPDANPPCALALGGSCPRGGTCPAGDGCNTCRCSGSGVLTCTEAACPSDASADGTMDGTMDGAPPGDAAGDIAAEAGPRTCTRNDECRSGETCIGQLGCGRPRICSAEPCVAMQAPFCNCTNGPFRASATCPLESYQSYGGCTVAPDGGGARRCTVDADCASGQTCEGLGCGTPDGYCTLAAGVCPGAMALYCGCDGMTVSASAMCPRRRFRAFGPCP